MTIPSFQSMNKPQHVSPFSLNGSRPAVLFGEDKKTEEPEPLKTGPESKPKSSDKFDSQQKKTAAASEVAKEDSKKTNTGQKASEQKTEEIASVEEVSKSGEQGHLNPPDSDPKATRQNLKLAKAMFFSSVIPLATSYLYTLGLLPGIVIGAPIAYFSGMYGRKLRQNINAEQVNQRLNAMDAFAEKLKKGPEQLGPEDFSQLFNSVAGNLADLRVTKALTWLKDTQAVKWLLNMGFVRNLTGKFMASRPVKWVSNRMGLVNTLRQQGASKAMEKTATGTVLQAFLKGMSINMRVANESNPFKAALAGAWGFICFVCWPITLAWNVAKGIFSGDNDNKQSQPT